MLEEIVSWPLWPPRMPGPAIKSRAAGHFPWISTGVLRFFLFGKTVTPVESRGKRTAVAGRLVVFAAELVDIAPTKASRKRPIFFVSRVVMSD